MTDTPAAANGEENGLMVLPSWRDLNPKNQFVKELYRKPLPSSINHQLFYAYKNSSLLKSGENSDGVVPLSSQLRAEAQQESSEQFGFNSSHVGILEDEKMLHQLYTKMANVENIFPESHMKILADGGIDIKLADEFSPITQHFVSYAGKYMVLLAKGKIVPINAEQKHFVQAIQGKTKTNTRFEKEFLLFMHKHPKKVENILYNYCSG